jgi:hypothetical protein
MEERSKSKNELVVSYLVLRRAIGILGILLPILLCLGAVIIFNTGIQNSVSSYYYTGMRDVLVGTLCAIGFFLLSYKGYKGDDIFGTLGCIFAVGMALFPTIPDNPTPGDKYIGYIHFACAALFFLTLIYFSLFLFTRTDKKKPAREKLKRNKVYRVCGYIMIICLALIGIYYLLPGGARSSLETLKPVFWLEAIAIWAFGVSWLTKGDTIFKDKAESKVQT